MDAQGAVMLEYSKILCFVNYIKSQIMRDIEQEETQKALAQLAFSSSD